MKVYFYKCGDDKRVLNKDITDEIKVDAKPYEGCSILQPSMILEYNAELLTRNYAYIPDWNRYYFVGNSTVEKGNRMIVPMSVDVLMSWEDGVRNAPIIAERSSNKYNSYIADPNINIKAYSQPEYHELGAFEGTQLFLLGVG